MSIKQIVLLMALSTCSPSLIARNFAPPWLLQSQNFMILAFNIKADEIKKLLPAGVEAAVNQDGAVNTVFEMYEADRASGIPAYSAVFITVDIKDHDSRDGGPAHFPLWGRIAPRESAKAFIDHFGFPYEYASISLTMEQTVYAGVVGDPGKEILRVKMQPLTDHPFSNQGIVNLVGRMGRRLIEIEVPYITQGYSARVSFFEIGPDADPILKIIKDSTPLWAAVSSEQAFAYSRPMSPD